MGAKLGVRKKCKEKSKKKNKEKSRKIVKNQKPVFCSLNTKFLSDFHNCDLAESRNIRII